MNCCQFSMQFRHLKQKLKNPPGFEYVRPSTISHRQSSSLKKLVQILELNKVKVNLIQKATVFLNLEVLNEWESLVVLNNSSKK